MIRDYQRYCMIGQFPSWKHWTFFSFKVQIKVPLPSQVKYINGKSLPETFYSNLAVWTATTYWWLLWSFWTSFLSFLRAILAQWYVIITAVIRFWIHIFRHVYPRNIRKFHHSGVMETKHGFAWFEIWNAYSNYWHITTVASR